MTFMAQADAHVRQNSPTVNYSATTYLRTGRILAPSDAYETLMQFEHFVAAGQRRDPDGHAGTVRAGQFHAQSAGLRRSGQLGENTVTWNTKPTYSTDYGSQTSTVWAGTNGT